jgi:hypothetical protein
LHRTASNNSKSPSEKVAVALKRISGHQGFVAHDKHNTILLNAKQQVSAHGGNFPALLHAAAGAAPL